MKEPAKRDYSIFHCCAHQRRIIIQKTKRKEKCAHKRIKEKRDREKNPTKIRKITQNMKL